MSIHQGLVVLVIPGYHVSMKSAVVTDSRGSCLMIGLYLEPAGLLLCWLLLMVTHFPEE